MLTTLLALLASVAVVFVTVHARPFPCNLPPLPPPPGRDLQPLQPPFFYPEMRSPPTPSMPNPTPPPGQDLLSLQPPLFFGEPSPKLLKPQFFFTEPRPPLSPSMPNLTPPPDQGPPSLQPPFFSQETRSPPPPSMPNITPPPCGDLPLLQPTFFFPEPSPQFLQPPVFYPPYLAKGHSPPASGSMFLQKLIISGGILAVILVLLLALRKCRGLDPETTIQAMGLSATVMTCLSA